MTYDMRSPRDFLVGLSREELSQTRDFIERLLRNSPVQQRIELGKRPHIAMPERRGESRYHVRISGRCWDALKIDPAEGEKYSVSVVNISRAGCCFLCETLFHPTQILTIEFQPPDEDKHPVLMEVVRARRPNDSSRVTHEIGCRIVDENHVEQARKYLEHRKTVRARLDDHGAIRSVHLGRNAANCPALRWLQDQEYDVAAVSSPRQIVSRMRSHGAHVLVCSVAALREGSRTWLRSLRRECPSAALVAVASSAKERGAARFLGAEQSVLESEIPERMRPVFERALYAQLAPPLGELVGAEVKVILAGHEEKRLRQLETLLLEERYLVAKCARPEDMSYELEMQRFDLLIASAGCFRPNRYDGISDLRLRYPTLVIVIETAGAAEAREALGKDADLTLPASWTRGELLECVNKARQIVMQRTFVR